METVANEGAETTSAEDGSSVSVPNTASSGLESEVCKIDVPMLRYYTSDYLIYLNARQGFFPEIWHLNT